MSAEHFPRLIRKQIYVHTLLRKVKEPGLRGTFKSLYLTENQAPFKNVLKINMEIFFYILKGKVGYKIYLCISIYVHMPSLKQ